MEAGRVRCLECRERLVISRYRAAVEEELTSKKRISVTDGDVGVKAGMFLA